MTMHEATEPTLKISRTRRSACAFDASISLVHSSGAASGARLNDPHHLQIQWLEPIFAASFERLADAALKCAREPSNYLMAQLSRDGTSRLRIEHAEAAEPFTTVLKDPGCAMLHCGVYVWLTVTHGSVNVTRPDARPSSCVRLLASSPDHVLARSRDGIELLIVPAYEPDLWRTTYQKVWASLTSPALALTV